MAEFTPKKAKNGRNLGIGFGVFFAFAIFGLVALTGYFVASDVLVSEKEHWRMDLERRLDFQEQRLIHFKDTAILFANNSYVTNGIIDVAGRGSYLPRELENMTKSKEIDYVGVVDFSGKPIAYSLDFPQSKVDKDLLRYVIETGRERLWCDPDGQQIFGAAPINYYNTPQGALLVVSKISTMQQGLSSDQPKSGLSTVLCGDRVLSRSGDMAGDRYMIDLTAAADPLRHSNAHMMDLKLRGSIALVEVFKPAFYLVLRLTVLGLAFMFVGGFIARSIERELIVARDGALEASKARSQFLANMSHEIRTPLNGVTGNINLLLEESLTQDQRALATDAKLSSQNLLELLNEILDFSKIDAGHMRLETAPVDLRRLMHTVERTYRGAMHEKGLSYGLIIDDEVPEMFMGDALRIRQILNNFFSNSVKFTNAGYINLRVGFDAVEKSLNFSISDSGIGIPQDRLDDLFTPFTQAEESTTRRFGGTGLGLSICRELAQLMSGNVAVVSEVGVGSVFKLKIPFVEASDQSEAWETAKLKVAMGTIEPMRVLVVEDNAVNASLMTRILSKYGHTVTVAGNGAQAVDLVLSETFDLILMDCQMPVMDGYEATTRIIAALGDRRPPIVALTANSFKEDRDKCFEVGMDDFLTKPVSRDALERIMRPVKKRIA